MRISDRISRIIPSTRQAKLVNNHNHNHNHKAIASWWVVYINPMRGELIMN